MHSQFKRVNPVLLIAVPALIVIVSIFLIRFSGRTRPIVKTALDPPVMPLDAPFATRKATNGVTVTDLGVPILTITRSYGGRLPQQRGQIVMDRLNDILINDLGHDGRPVTQMIDADEGHDPIVFFGYKKRDTDSVIGDLIITVDPVTARDAGAPSPRALACWWRDILRDWLLMNTGRAPQYTTKYVGVLKKFYDRLQLDRDRSHDQARFKAAMGSLNDQDILAYEHLNDLSMKVPANYVPDPSGIHNPVVASDSLSGTHH